MQDTTRAFRPNRSSQRADFQCSKFAPRHKETDPSHANVGRGPACDDPKTTARTIRPPRVRRGFTHLPRSRFTIQPPQSPLNMCTAQQRQRFHTLNSAEGWIRIAPQRERPDQSPQRASHGTTARAHPRKTATSTHHFVRDCEVEMRMKPSLFP